MIHKNKDFFTFVRYGILKPVLQKGFGKDTFHAPPSKYGFYAFTKPFQEMFLVGCIYKTQPQLFSKNFEGWDKAKLSSLKKEFKAIKGEMWHHLTTEVKPKDILGLSGAWVKTTIKVWEKALNKSITKDLARFGIHNSTMGNFSKDAYEVFFEYLPKNNKQ